MISAKIKEVRKHFNLSQKDFGEKLGVSRDVVTNIEYGRVEPKDWFIDHLCNTFLISKKWLIFDEGDMIDNSKQTKSKANIAIGIISELSPELQEYALEQLRNILKLQNNIEIKQNDKNNAPE